jgi:hypothetical protein
MRLAYTPTVDGLRLELAPAPRPGRGRASPRAGPSTIPQGLPGRAWRSRSDLGRLFSKQKMQKPKARNSFWRKLGLGVVGGGLVWELVFMIEAGPGGIMPLEGAVEFRCCAEEG